MKGRHVGKLQDNIKMDLGKHVVRIMSGWNWLRIVPNVRF